MMPSKFTTMIFNCPIGVLDVPNEHECEVLWAVTNSQCLPEDMLNLL